MIQNKRNLKSVEIFKFKNKIIFQMILTTFFVFLISGLKRNNSLDISFPKHVHLSVPPLTPARFLQNQLLESSPRFIEHSL